MARILGDLSEGVIVTDVKGSITFIQPDPPRG